MTLTQVGSNVVANGSGTINLAGLTLAGSPPGGISPFLVPNFGRMFTGPTPSAAGDVYQGISGPASFGGGEVTFASSGSGDVVGVEGDAHTLAVPAGYVSGNALSDTATYDNQTFASLGVTPGTYVWTWGTAAADDSFTLQVPEPGSLALLVTALIGLGALGWGRRRSA